MLTPEEVYIKATDPATLNPAQPEIAVQLFNEMVPQYEKIKECMEKNPVAFLDFWNIVVSQASKNSEIEKAFAQMLVRKFREHADFVKERLAKDKTSSSYKDTLETIVKELHVSMNVLYFLPKEEDDCSWEQEYWQAYKLFNFSDNMVHLIKQYGIVFCFKEMADHLRARHKSDIGMGSYLENHNGEWLVCSKEIDELEKIDAKEWNTQEVQRQMLDSIANMHHLDGIFTTYKLYRCRMFEESYEPLRWADLSNEFKFETLLENAPWRVFDLMLSWSEEVYDETEDEIYEAKSSKMKSELIRCAEILAPRKWNTLDDSEVEDIKSCIRLAFIFKLEYLPAYKKDFELRPDFNLAQKQAERIKKLMERNALLRTANRSLQEEAEGQIRGFDMDANKRLIDALKEEIKTLKDESQVATRNYADRLSKLQTWNENLMSQREEQMTYKNRLEAEKRQLENDKTSLQLEVNQLADQNKRLVQQSRSPNLELLELKNKLKSLESNNTRITKKNLKLKAEVDQLKIVEEEKIEELKQVIELRSRDQTVFERKAKTMEDYLNKIVELKREKRSMKEANRKLRETNGRLTKMSNDKAKSIAQLKREKNTIENERRKLLEEIEICKQKAAGLESFKQIPSSSTTSMIIHTAGAPVSTIAEHSSSATCSNPNNRPSKRSATETKTYSDPEKVKKTKM